MNTAVKFMMGTLLAFALSACSQETTEKKVDDMNGKISRLNAISVALAQEGISLNDSSLYSTRSSSRTLPSNMSNDKATYVRGLLNEYVTLGNQVLMRTNDKDVYFSDTAKLKSQVSSAQSYLTQMDGYEARRDREKADSQKRFDRKRTDGENMHIALDELKSAEKLEEEIRSRYNHNVTGTQSLRGLDRMDTRKLENMRDDAKKLMAHSMKAQSLMKGIDRSNLSYTSALDRALTALATNIQNVEARLGEMNRELRKRTGDPREDMPRAKPRIQ
ncbi:MAG: hypothetical protein KF767_11160 [Bdellovibrionaceae bacterium]|nr:hypothetical protein [Pseudobdellovibrionaceae bacterium]